MKRRWPLTVLGGGLLAALSVAVPVLVVPLVDRTPRRAVEAYRLPQAPPEYPDPNVVWVDWSPGLVRESSIRGVGVYHGWHVTRLRAGWPLPMLEGGDYCEIDSDGGAASGTVHPINLKSWWSQDAKHQWQLPLGLVWGGLGIVGNWAAWSAAIGVLFLPGAVKRGLRRRRGQCIACGYPRSPGVPTCPECGKAEA